MAEFLGDIAVMFEVLILGAGLVVLHFGKKQSAKLILWAGNLLVAASVAGLICSGYYYFKYFFAGEFEHAYPTAAVQGGPMGMGQMSGMMSNGMMGRGMGQGMMGKGQMSMQTMMMNNMQKCMSGMQGKMMDNSMMKDMKSCMMNQAMESQRSADPDNSSDHESHHPEEEKK